MQSSKLDPREYDPGMKALHWLTAALIFVALAIGLTLEDIARGPGRSWWTAQHELAGVLVLALIATRLVWRVARGAPGQVRDLPAWQQRAAQLAHWSLYGLIAASAAIGVCLSWARGRSVGIPGLFDLPSLIVPDRALGRTLEAAHSVVSYTLLALVAVHVVAALYHHFVRHDAVLRRMLPRRPAP
jgi:cytochrome b561